MHDLEDLVGREVALPALRGAVDGWFVATGTVSAARVLVGCPEAPPPGEGFRLFAPGATYPFGALALAQRALAARGSDAARAVVVEVWSHAGAAGTCGVLADVLAGADTGAAHRLARALRSEGLDRVAALATLPPAPRPLLAAAVAARLAARNVRLDVDERPHRAPACFLVLHGFLVAADRVVLGGFYELDRRPGRAVTRHVGHGDDPRALLLSVGSPVALAADPASPTVEPCEPRAVVRALAESRDPPRPEDDPRLDRFARALASVTAETAWTPARLKVLVRLLADRSPSRTALLLFGEGLIDARHYDHLANGGVDAEGARAARDILRESESRLEGLDGDRVRALVRALLPVERAAAARTWDG